MWSVIVNLFALTFSTTEGETVRLSCMAAQRRNHCSSRALRRHHLQAKGWMLPFHTEALTQYIQQCHQLTILYTETDLCLSVSRPAITYKNQCLERFLSSHKTCIYTFSLKLDYTRISIGCQPFNTYLGKKACVDDASELLSKLHGK